MKNPTIVPFVKWAGGKRQLLSVIEVNLPTTFNTYYEPFIGGGALLFHLQPEKAVINDLNKELIDTYKAIRSDVNRVREYLLLMEYGHYVIPGFDGDKGKTKKISPFYEKIRSIDLEKEFNPRKLNMKDSIYLRAARFIFLNKNTFNGLYRVNLKGHFNSPSKHNDKQATFDWKKLKAASKYLKTIEAKNIKNTTFKEAIKNAKKGDFVYFDPPYDYEVGTNGFDSYQKGGFGSKGQKELAEVCKSLNKKGVRFIVSNHNTKFIRELYKDFNIKVVKAKRMIGGAGASRKDVEEVLIKNYE